MSRPTPGDKAVRTVAIDGPGGAGKSTLARSLAVHLGLDRLDTGAMYRSVAWAALAEDIDVHDAAAVAALAGRLTIEVGDDVIVDGRHVTQAIRSAEIDAAVSAVAANPAVRAVMVEHQRHWVEQRGGGVVEGRDIGTVVLPDADVKVYLTARTGERARRRAAERGDRADSATIAEALDRRDALDSTRAVSPLPAVDQAPPDAIVIDSTDKPAEAVLEEVLKHL